MQQGIAQPRVVGTPGRVERFGKRVVKILDSIVNMAMLTIFLLFMLYGAYSLWDQNQIYQAADAKVYAQYKPVGEDGEDSPSFAELRSINADVFAWLTVYGTNIDYPLVHTDNNETYVNTDVMRNFSLSGSLFLDYNNAPDFSDYNSIVYGHHMEKNAMFGNLTDFLNADYFAEHQYGNLYYNGVNRGIEFLAFMEVDAYDSSVYNLNVQEGREQEYLDNLFAKATNSRLAGIEATDQLILLSTCTSTSTNGRHILVGRIVGSPFPDTFEKEREGDGAGRLLQSVDSQAGQLLQRLPWWVWVALAVLLIAVLVHSIGKRTRKRAYGKV